MARARARARSRLEMSTVEIQPDVRYTLDPNDQARRVDLNCNPTTSGSLEIVHQKEDVEAEGADNERISDQIRSDPCDRPT